MKSSAAVLTLIFTSYSTIINFYPLQVTLFSGERHPTKSHMKRYYRDSPAMFLKMKNLILDIYSEFGWKTRLIAPVMGCYAFLRLLKEDRQLSNGWQYEPQSHYEKNPKAAALHSQQHHRCQAGHNPFVTTPAPL